VRERSINLTFHGVGDHGRALEAAEEHVWLSAADFEAVLDAAVGRDDVRITFDDGNASDVAHALPALSRRGLSATFFVVAGRLGEPGFLDADDVRALAAAGMTIGCHGMRHRPWRRLDDRDLVEELVESRKVLEAVVERPVTGAACPFGAYDRRVLRSLRQSGYEQVYTSDTGMATPDRWLQVRNTVCRGDGGDLLERIVSSERSRGHALRRRAKLAAKRWR
jgi:peptidoglycan/xylan/chitin deacetylase (PgdA/CDA1 family)